MNDTQVPTRQQDQTLRYFRTHAEAWHKEASGGHYSVIENRHQAVIEVLKGHPTAQTFLDIGCGTGQLAIEVNRRGLAATGLDFAPEMIAQCEANNRAARTSARFVPASIFNYPLPQAGYDVISAQGFIEYISLAQLDQFLAMVRRALTPGGRMALGSRNRLFNLHALNTFTELERSLGTIDRLVHEAMLLQTALTQQEAVERMAHLRFIYPQLSRHPMTGVTVDTRYQFTPADLATRLKEHGLKATRIFPVHYHGLPIAAFRVEALRTLHDQLATLMSETRITDHTLIPSSSSFVLEACAV
jgi:SAM-dependent methyltransferase